MKLSINIGSTPGGEDCEQVGPNYDPQKARFECQVFIRQLRRKFGPEPDGARLYIKRNEHDSGSYVDVECEYNEGQEDSREYAYRCEGGEGPEYWDAEALAELCEKYPDTKSNE